MAIIEQMIASNFAFGSVIHVSMSLINAGNLVALPVVNIQLVMSAKVAINAKWTVSWKFPLMAVLIYSGGIVLQNGLIAHNVPNAMKFFPPGNYSFLLILLYTVPYILHFGAGIMVFGIAVSGLREETEVTQVTIYIKHMNKR